MVARRVCKRQTCGESVLLYNQAMHDRLQDAYCLLLEEATSLMMKDGKGYDIYYDILDILYDLAVQKYMK